jgi:hypothetical protein
VVEPLGPPELLEPLEPLGPPELLEPLEPPELLEPLEPPELLELPELAELKEPSFAVRISIWGIFLLASCNVLSSTAETSYWARKSVSGVFFNAF